MVGEEVAGESSSLVVSDIIDRRRLENASHWRVYSVSV